MTQRFIAKYQGFCYCLAMTLREVPKERHPAVAARIIYHDLMRGPWWFQFLVGLIRLRGRVVERLELLYRRNPELASDLIEQTGWHITSGKDTEDKDSYGGFSQREMDLMVGILEVT